MHTVSRIGLSLLMLSGIFFLGSCVNGQLVRELDADPSHGPVVAAMIQVDEIIPLTTAVQNPAGIAFIADTGTYLISTDDSVLHEVSHDFSAVLSSLTFDISRDGIAIGDTEGVAHIGDDRAVAISENGVLLHVQRHADGTWAERRRIVIRGLDPSLQLASAAYDPVTGLRYSAVKTGPKLLYAIDPDSGDLRQTPLVLADHLTMKRGRAWAPEFTVSGLVLVDGRLLALSEAYSSLLTLGTDGTITAVTGVQGMEESAGITSDGRGVVILGDAEPYLPDPPIYRLHHAPP